MSNFFDSIYSKIRNIEFLLGVRMFWVSLIFTVCICISIYKLAKLYPEYKRKKKCLSAIPGPPGLPLIGNGLQISSTVDLHQKMAEWVRRYGRIMKLEIGPMIQYITTDPGLIEYVTTSNTLITKAHFYKFTFPWIGDGLITSTGDKWRSKRKIITPAFHFHMLIKFVEFFERHSDILVEKFKNLKNKSSLEIYGYLSLATLDIICESSMGVSLNAQTETNSPYVASVRFLANNIIERSFSLIKQFDFSYSFTNTYKEEQKHLKTVNNFSQSVIKNRRKEYLQKKLESGSVANSDGTKKKIAFLDTLLAAEVDGKPLTDTEIKDQVDTFMFAAHDTTATTLSFLFYAMAKYPNIQEKVYDEIISIIGEKRDEPLHHSDLTEMKYLEMVIKEVMRVYTIAPFIGRTITEEFQYGPYTFLKGATLLLYLQGLHMDPENFEDPETFNPDRWLNIRDEKCAFTYLPFSAGPRNCIGQKYAVLEIKVIVAKVMLNFKIIPSDPEIELQLASEGVLKSVSGVHIGLEPRVAV